MSVVAVMPREQKATTRIFLERFFYFVLTPPLHTAISEYTRFNPCFAFLYSPRSLHGTVNHSRIILNIYIYLYLRTILRHTYDCDLYALCSSSSEARGLPEKYSARCVALPTSHHPNILSVSVTYCIPTCSSSIRTLLCHIVSKTFYYNTL